MVSFLAIVLSEYLFLLPILVGGIYFFLQPSEGKKRMVILSAISLPLTILAMFILNQVYDNPRPEVVLNFKPLLQHFFANNGFPSTHATLTALIASIMYVFNRKLGIFLFVISILVSLSRVYLGLHHFVDVFAGILLAIGVTIVSKAIIQNLISKPTENNPYL